MVLQKSSFARALGSIAGQAGDSHDVGPAPAFRLRVEPRLRLGVGGWLGCPREDAVSASIGWGRTCALLSSASA